MFLVMRTVEFIICQQVSVTMTQGEEVRSGGGTRNYHPTRRGWGVRTRIFRYRVDETRLRPACGRARTEFVLPVPVATVSEGTSLHVSLLILCPLKSITVYGLR